MSCKKKTPTYLNFLKFFCVGFGFFFFVQVFFLTFLKKKFFCWKKVFFLITMSWKRKQCLYIGNINKLFLKKGSRNQFVWNDPVNDFQIWLVHVGTVCDFFFLLFEISILILNYTIGLWNFFFNGYLNKYININ